MDLLWFGDITWDTPLRDIGWSYLFLLGLVCWIAYLIYQVFWKR